MIILGDVVNNEYLTSYHKQISMYFSFPIIFFSWGSSTFLPSSGLYTSALKAVVRPVVSAGLGVGGGQVGESRW